MFNSDVFKQKLIHLKKHQFEEAALSLFQYQWGTNPTYHAYCSQLRKDPGTVKRVEDIPFLPIEFFKSHTIKSGEWEEQTYFLSSGTTSQTRSRSFVKDQSYYHQVCKAIFEKRFGPLDQHFFVGILPSYRENPHSSLISMVDFFMENGQNEERIYLDNLDFFKININKIQFNSVVLFGVTYALIETLQEIRIDTGSITLIETGGMKGRDRELVREEVHTKIKEVTGVSRVFSEYGMTELTSQAYGENGLFHSPEWLKILIRDINDPFTYVREGLTGGVNIIDLANVDTCAFIETKDIGRSSQFGQFEILGRFDNSDIRGCSLLI